MLAETSLVQFTGQPHNQIYTNLFGKTDEFRIGRRGGLFWLCLELISGPPVDRFEEPQGQECQSIEERLLSINYALTRSFLGS